MLAFHYFYEETLAAHTIKVELDVKPENCLKQYAESKDGKTSSPAIVIEDLKPEEPIQQNRECSPNRNCKLADESDHDFANDQQSSISSDHESEEIQIKRAREHFWQNSTTPPTRRSAQPKPIGKYFSMKCTQCDTTLIDLAHANRHYKAQHSTNGFLMCCDKKFDTQKTISDHFLFHEQQSSDSPSDAHPRLDEDALIRKNISLVCDICGSALDSFRECQLHYRTVHGRVGYLMCCGKKFYKKCRLLQHLQWHEDPRKFE